MGEQGSSLSDTSLSDSPPNCEEFIVEQLKKCRTCGVEKPLDLFYNHKTAKDGKLNTCKICRSAQTSAYQKRHPEQTKRIHKKHYELSKTTNLKRRLGRLLTTAKSRNRYEVLITLEDLENLYDSQNGLCVYSKLPLTLKPHQLTTISLDRIDSSKGYVLGNIQLVGTAINKMKLNYSDKQFIQLCCCVSQHHKAEDYPTELAHLSLDI
jgi:hypothetical protein